MIAFGGPLNEKFIQSDSNRIVAHMPPRVTLPADIDIVMVQADLASREVLYTRERVAYREWVAECWVAYGYPKHRITDPINAIIGLCRLLGGRQ